MHSVVLQASPASIAGYYPACLPFHHTNFTLAVGLEPTRSPPTQLYTDRTRFKVQRVYHSTILTLKIGNPCQNQTDAAEFKARPSIIKCKGQLFF